MQAIISAGIVHTVTKNCSLGQLKNCACDDKSKKDKESYEEAKERFRWGGCSDNIELGFNLAKTFLDDREIGHDTKAIITLHNNEVGRLVSSDLLLPLSFNTTNIQ